MIISNIYFYIKGMLDILDIIQYVVLLGAAVVGIFCFRKRGGNKYTGLLVFFMCAVTFHYIIEVCTNEFISVKYIFVNTINVILYFIVYVLFLLLLKSYQKAIIVGSASSLFLALLNHFLILFRDRPIMACDLYAVRTALDVAGKFSFKVDTMVFAVCLWGIAMMILALWFLKRLGLTHISWKPLTRFGTVTGIILILMISFQGKVLEKYTEVKPFYYSHGTNCFALNFILQLVNYKIEPPKGYEISAIDTTELSMEVERGGGGDRILL